MAKVGLWLRGARGKLAGTVFSKGENGTIARELAVPTNRQTDAQMLQRIAFATVSKAATHLLPVIGMSFEGKTTEKENRREFIARNVNLLKNNIKAQLAGEESYNALSARVIPKGEFTLIPNTYILSQGSLSIPNIFEIKTLVTYTVSGELSAIESYFSDEIPIFHLKDDIKIKDFIIELMGGDVAGKQITIVFLKQTFDPNSDGKKIQITKPSFYRLVFKDSYPNGTFEPGMNKDEWETFTQDFIDLDKSSQILVDWFFNLNTSGSNESGFWYNLSTLDDTFNVEGVCGLSCIVSKNIEGIWHYSTSYLYPTLKINSKSGMFNNYGVVFPAALPSYLKSQSATASDFYTQQGGKQNSIG